MKAAQFVTCKKCGTQTLPHTVCLNCGEYKGRQFVDVLANLNKKERKAKEQELSEKENK